MATNKKTKRLGRESAADQVRRAGRSEGLKDVWEKIKSHARQGKLEKNRPAHPDSPFYLGVYQDDRDRVAKKRDSVDRAILKEKYRRGVK